MMHGVLVDSNVLLDVMTEDPVWYEWSSAALEEHGSISELYLNQIIYAEVSVGYARIEDLEAALPKALHRLPLPWEAAFLAGKAFLRYRRQGGTRTSVLPDFFIGAHAAVTRLKLLTRDGGRYRTYFPGVELVGPEGG
jgi:hypothetical protein